MCGISGIGNKNEDELLIFVKAAAIKHFDKGRASGKHYGAKKIIATGGNEQFIAVVACSGR